MPHLCVYCFRELKGHLKGRPATPEQVKHATTYHHPHTVTATHICDTHRRHPPNSSQKRSRSPSSDSHQSSDSHVSSKRQQVAEILTSIPQSNHQLTLFL